MESWRDRKFRLLLYPDDETHQKAIIELEQAGYKYAAILHENDEWSNDDPDLGEHEAGTLKKPHWHVVVKFQNAIWSSALAKKLGIKENYIRDCKNLDGSLLYLVHENQPDKYQYDIEEVFGDLKPALAKLLADDDEGSRVLNIVHIIDSCPGRCTYREILIKACNAGLYGEFRRLGSGVKWLIDEHNDDYAISNISQQREKVNRIAQDFGESVRSNSELNFVKYAEQLTMTSYKIPEL